MNLCLDVVFRCTQSPEFMHRSVLKELILPPRTCTADGALEKQSCAVGGGPLGEWR